MYGPAEIAKRYSDAGAGKTKLALPKMFVLAMFAGMFIAFGAFGSQVVSVGAEIPAVGKLLGALVFPVGLLMVIMAGAELFTGNSLIIISVLDGKATVKGMLRNWVVVYLGNFVGSIFVAAILTYGHAYSLFDGKLAESVVATAQTKVMLSLPDAFLRAILCNILVCIAVWISFSAEDVAGKILGLYLPIMLFVVSGYEHCVANMYFIPAGIFASGEYGIAADALNWTACFVNNLLPVTIGNVLGGVCVVGLGYFFAYLHRAPKAKAAEPTQVVDTGKKELMDLSANQNIVGITTFSENAVPISDFSPFAPEPREPQARSIEVMLNGATIRIPNEADPALLAQTIRLVKHLS